MKKVSLGIENFGCIINECYFVDKSLFIQDFINLPTTSVLLVTRPRRFGKSLAVSMLDSFFNVNIKNTVNVFENLKIWNCDDNVKQEYGSKPVVRLNFKEVYGNNFDEIIKQVRYSILNEYKKHISISNGLFKSDNYIKLLNNEVDLIELKHYLFYLIQDVSLFYNQRVLLLIDEYDSPVQAAFDNNFYDECIEFFKPFYSEALKGNDNLYKGFITGVVRITKESLFSGLNNIIVDCVTDKKYQEFFGFTYEETKEMLSYFGVSTEFDKVIKYYGGYLFGNIKVVNPWSILSFILNEYKYSCYWVNTSTNHILESIDKNNRINDISEILQSSDLIVKVDSVCSYKDLLNNSQTVLLYLLNSGYLTINDYLTDDVAVLSIPNIEIQKVFQEEIVNRYIKENPFELIYKLRLAIINEDNKTFEDIIKNNLLNSFSYYDLGSEKNYQIFVLTLSALLFDNYIVKSECIAGSGRCDIIIKPKKENDIGIVIEVKSLKQRTSNERLNNASLSAIKQAINLNYIEELMSLNCKKKIIYGIAFYGKNVKINYKVI